MATSVKRIEKEFYLKVLYDEQLPIRYIKDQVKYTLTVEKPTKNKIYLKIDPILENLKSRTKMDLMFDFRGMNIIFSIDVTYVLDDHIIAEAPEYLYKNLDRSYSRVTIPPDLDVQFTFLGERYSLGYPRITEFENDEPANSSQDMVPQNFTGLIKQMGQWIAGYADGYKLVLFKEVQPSTIEERILAETGKTLYLPSTKDGIPVEDPYPRKRIITRDLFHRYLESTGTELKHVEQVARKFMTAKLEQGVMSEAWLPILFHEYVIGYIHVWNNKAERGAINYTVIDNLYQFAKILAYSLKLSGYFDEGLIDDNTFEGSVIDISVSGLLFAYPSSSLSSSLLPDCELSIRLTAPKRSINTNAVIVRRYRDGSMGYFGCRFLDMAPEDLRFLFEYIYGRPITDEDAVFLFGNV